MLEYKKFFFVYQDFYWLKWTKKKGDFAYINVQYIKIVKLIGKAS